MCTGAEAAVLAGTGAQMYGDQQTRRDQARELERRSEQANQLNTRAGSRVSQEVQSLKDSTADAGKADETKLQGDFMAALRRSQLQSGGSGLDSTPGAVSDQYSSDAATAHTANVAGNRAAVTNAARLDAPFMQRVREGAGASRTASDLSRLENEGRGQDFLAQLRASLITPNAGLNAAGDLAKGWGAARSQRMLPVKPVKSAADDAYDTAEQTFNPGGRYNG